MNTAAKRGGPRLSPAIWGTVAIALTGVWLLLSPQAAGDQPAGAPWTAATINAVVVGGTLLLTGAAAVWAMVVLWGKDAWAASAARDQERRGDATPSS
jgi:drug/metabolite transporter (DMT)-like permease